jgi:A/G-specific adenine glycosylase
MPLAKRAIEQFHARLHSWYNAHGRKTLPWRNTTDAYAIYISEIMLQQTQVKTVLERYYAPFLKRFPTLSHLARSEADDVLQAWQGLGYYNRALNLRAAAQACQKALPETVDGLMALPGIGRNTAHAVCAFAYHQPVAVMEANVKRVVSRIFALTDPKDPELWEKATLLLDTKNPFDYNQAMMDIGSMVCLKRKPLCGQCPASSICEGQETPEAYPAPKVKKTVPVREKHIAVLRNPDGHYYATARSSRFLNGLYHFIETEKDNNSVLFHKQALPLSAGQMLGHVRQQYSHFTLEADIWLLDVPHSRQNHWYPLAELKKLPVSMAETKILALIAAIKPAKPKSPKQ